MSLDLSFAEVGAGPPLVILHGLFGSGRNWASLARRLGERHRVFTLDLRNHGQSPWAASMTYREMAADVAAFLAHHGIEGATVIGHSMGGKTAMVLALERSELIGRLIVVDIAPVAYRHSHLALIDAMRRVDLEAASRRGDVDEALKHAVPDIGLRGFLLQNLVSEAGRLRWRLNLAAIAANMDGLIGYPGDLDGLRYGGPTLFLAGAASDYVPAGAAPRIRALFPAAEIDAIAGAGHWVHAEQPEAFLARVEAFLEG